MTRVFLITGGCGFVGSNLALSLKRDFPGSRVIAMDNLWRRGSELNLERLHNAGVDFIHGDIRNSGDFNSVGIVTDIIEAAAEPSVLSGIDSSADYVINTNLTGAVNCFDYARKYSARLIFLSTSRVYPVRLLQQIEYFISGSRFEIDSTQTLPGVSLAGINENFPVNGHRSFYGASKYAAEVLLAEYQNYYNLKAVINRCGVIAGPWQMGKIDQGIISFWMAKHYWKKELQYIGYGGEGLQVRDILHVDDLYDLVKMQLENMEQFEGRIFNVGGGRNVSVSLKELTTACAEITGNQISITGIREERQADIPVYITDNSSISNHCGWKPGRNMNSILEDTYNWMRIYENELKNLLG